MSGVRRAIASQVRSDHLGAVCNVPVVDGTVKEGKSTLRLVIRHLVSGFVNAEETQVAILADLSVLSAVDGEGLVAGCSEFLAVGVVQGKRNGLATEPVADVVGITV